MVLLIVLWRDLNSSREYRPFILSISIFLMGYLGLGLSIYPWIIPFNYTLHQSAASSPSLSLMLIGVVPMLPIILSYTAYCYYVFRGKTHNENLY
jgi:cytochrome d ubiquinol oxidase subunit II